MKIGLYLDSRQLKQWSWNEFLAGEIGLSGTHSQNLHIAYDLAANGHEVFFFSTQIATPVANIKHIQVDTLEIAVIQAKSAELDILIFNNFNNQETVNGVRKCETVGQACVVWEHNGPSPEMANLLFNSKSVRRVVCVAATQADNLRDHPIFEKIEFVHNALDLNLLKGYDLNKRNPDGVCYLGALKPAKGFQHLAKAWPTVHAAFPKATLNVLGSAQLYNQNSALGPLGVAEPEFELSYIVPHLGSTTEEAKSKGVTFFGLTSPKTIHSVIASSTIGVVNPNCSRFEFAECCSVSSLEIQALGAAIVGGNVGGLKETVDNRRTGILIDTEEELAAVLIKLLSNIDKSTKMGKNGIKWVAENFNRDMIVQRWCSLLEAAIRNEKPRLLAFSWKRATLKVAARESIRQMRKVPLLKNQLSTLQEMKALLTKV